MIVFALGLPLAVLLLILVRTTNSAYDLIAIVGPECEFFHYEMSPIFLGELEAPICKVRSRICLVDGTSIQAVAESDMAKVFTGDELAVALRFVRKSIWKKWTICVFRNCDHANKLEQRAKNYKAGASPLRTSSGAAECPRNRDDDTFPVIF